MGRGIVSHGLTPVARIVSPLRGFEAHMRETERIEDQLKRAFYGEAWHGPAVKEALQGVTAQMAMQRPIPNAHTIWELVHHIQAWIEIVKSRVLGQKVNVTDEVNFPPVKDSSEAGWQESIKRLEQADAELRKTVLSLPESRLEEAGVEGGSSVYILLHGAVQHKLYHTGQIALLKKSVSP